MNKSTIKNLKKRLNRYNLLRTMRILLRERKELHNWDKSGRPVPPPHAVKRGIIKEFAHKHPSAIFIETGTYKGDMVHAVRALFSMIYSIELDRNLYDDAVARFLGANHIKILHGDSAKLLPALLSRIDEPSLFWLDGHYSGSATAKGDLDTPILLELRHIFDHPVKNHTILIDDARCFVGENDYPTLEQLRAFILQRRPDFAFEVEDDVIRVYRKT